MEEETRSQSGYQWGANSREASRICQCGRDNSESTSTQEDLFSVTVKRVCAQCHDDWINNLDSVIEPSVFDPDDDESRCDPEVLRRWTIKIVPLCLYYENPVNIESSDTSGRDADVL